MLHDPLCGITYNGKSAKIYCAAERDDCVAIKHLNNESGKFYGFGSTVHVSGQKLWENASSVRDVIRNTKKLILICFIDSVENSMTDK